MTIPPARPLPLLTCPRGCFVRSVSLSKDFLCIALCLEFEIEGRYMFPLYGIEDISVALKGIADSTLSCMVLRCLLLVEYNETNMPSSFSPHTATTANP